MRSTKAALTGDRGLPSLSVGTGEGEPDDFESGGWAMLFPKSYLNFIPSTALSAGRAKRPKRRRMYFMMEDVDVTC